MHTNVILCFLMWIPLPTSVADPGFSWEGANFQSGCANLLFCNCFCQKLHENETIWTPGGGGARISWIRQCTYPKMFCYNSNWFLKNQRQTMNPKKAIFFCLITDRIRIMGKVMFPQAFVCSQGGLFAEGVSGLGVGGVWSWGVPGLKGGG